MGPPGGAGVAGLGAPVGDRVGESHCGTLQQGFEGSLVKMHPAGKLRYFRHLENENTI